LLIGLDSFALLEMVAESRKDTRRMPMAKKSEAKSDNNTAKLMVRVFDGTRRPIDAKINLLITIRDGFQKEWYRRNRKGPTVLFEVPFNNNLADNYTVIVAADGYKDAGFTPVKVSPEVQRVVDLMLLPKNWKFNFSQADWGTLKQTRPQLYNLLAHGVDDGAAETRYQQLMQQRPAALAGLYNVTTAMSQMHLAEGTALDYFKELSWDDSLQQDRFFAYADKRLIDQVKLAAEQGLFAPEPGAGFFHKGATLSYKQLQFGEANVQISFHESDTRKVDKVECVKVEPDVDYYKDLGAHALFEVVPNHITGGLTNPEQVYVLRWIAGQHAGIPEFDPPYTLEA
jgi:hypothetical protein